MPIVYNYDTFEEGFNGKSGIELIKLRPLVWDINIVDKYGKGKRDAMLRFQDTYWEYIKVTSYDDRTISGTDILKDWPALMAILKKRRYTDIYLTRIKEYIDQMIRINVFDKWRNSERKEIHNA